jgi:hypothetical protein
VKQKVALKKELGAQIYGQCNDKGTVDENK